MQESERRAARRYSVALPVELAGGSAVTRDISAAGVFFEADRSFSPGGQLSFALILEHADPVAPLRLECEGTIVRVEPDGRRIGVAAALTEFRINLDEPGWPAGQRRPPGEAVELDKGESP